VRVFASSSFIALANLSCGQSATNESLCWVSNAIGELGIGTTDTSKHGPTAVATAERFQSIAVIESSTPMRCGLRGDGAGFCWGGVYGPTPTRMAGNVTWRRFATRGPCGLAVDSTAYCWSGNAAPVQVGTGMKFIDIAVAYYGGRCALTEAGRAYCWRGDTAVLVTGDPPLLSLAVISVGPNSLGTGVCGLSAAGDLYCVAEAGPSATRTFSLQRRDLGGRKFRSVSGNCGIALDDKVYCWTWGNVVTVVPGQ